MNYVLFQLNISRKCRQLRNGLTTVDEIHLVWTFSVVRKQHNICRVNGFIASQDVERLTIDDNQWKKRNYSPLDAKWCNDCRRNIGQFAWQHKIIINHSFDRMKGFISSYEAMQKGFQKNGHQWKKRNYISSNAQKPIRVHGPGQHFETKKGGKSATFFRAGRVGVVRLPTPTPTSLLRRLASPLPKPDASEASSHWPTDGYVRCTRD